MPRPLTGGGQFQITSLFQCKLRQCNSSHCTPLHSTPFITLVYTFMYN